MKRVLTYGTFDLLHYGHINLLKRAKALGDYLIVALSTDEFNAGKGKKAFHDYETRKMMLEAIRYVDLVIPEESWDQKISDVKDYHVDVVVMGSDWENSDRFDYLKDYCELVFLHHEDQARPRPCKRKRKCRSAHEPLIIRFRKKLFIKIADIKHAPAADTLKK